MKKRIILPLLVSLLSLSGCSGNNTPVEHTVTLHFGNNVTRYERVKDGEKYQEPLTPLSPSHNFSGWYLNQGLSSWMKAAFPLQVIDDIELFASWNIKILGVTAITNARSPRKTVMTIDYGDFLVESSIFRGINPGYTFDCWCEDEELTIPFDFSTRIINDITIYGRWIQNP